MPSAAGKVCVPDAQIILFGCDEGVAEAAAELGVEHCPSVHLSDYGVPMLNSIVVQVRACAIHPMLCFANSDSFFAVT